MRGADLRLSDLVVRTAGDAEGLLDRVWIPHATFEMPEADEADRPGAHQHRIVAAVSTLGSPWWWWKVGMGEPGRRILLRGLSVLCAPGCKTFWMGLHEMDSAPEAKRRAFLDRVRKRFAALS